MRAMVVALAALALSGCNMVVSKEPWFSPADAKDAPRLREGTWAVLRTPDCQIDPARPASEWPECASPMLVKGDTYAGPRGEEEERASDPATWDVIRHLLVGGHPMVDQIRMGEKDEQGRPPKDGDTGYLYMGVDPTALDDQGRIVGARIWPVVCGPLPPKGKGKGLGKLATVTDKPFKGLKVEGMACSARDLAALRNAAVKSEAILKPERKGAITLRWLRD